MTTALPGRQQQRLTAQVSFGPFRFIEALPWLVLAAAARVIAFGGGPIALLATLVASIAVLHAFLVTAQRSIELADGKTSLGQLDFKEQSILSLAILGRIGLLMLVASFVMVKTGYASLASFVMVGIDGMAFDQFTDLGKFWSATIAALTLLMMIGAEHNQGRVNFFGAVGEFARRIVWVGAAVMVLGVVYLGLGFGQELVRSTIWNFWQTSSSSQLTKNLIYFVFIFSFAMLRLWITLLILTYGLKQSYARAD
jgi:hypothetical protein